VKRIADGQYYYTPAGLLMLLDVFNGLTTASFKSTEGIAVQGVGPTHYQLLSTSIGYVGRKGILEGRRGFNIRWCRGEESRP
jgi:hypothetical protein